MYYYSKVIFVSILLVLSLGIFFYRQYAYLRVRGEEVSLFNLLSFKYKDPLVTVFLIGIVVFNLVASYGTGSIWTKANTRLYERLMTSDQILVDGETVSFCFEYEGNPGIPYYGSGPPVYAKTGDVLVLKEFTLVNTQAGRSETIRLCRLYSAKNYTTDTYFEWNGATYCFLSERFLYNNAFYLFPDAFAQQLLDALLET